MVYSSLTSMKSNSSWWKATHGYHIQGFTATEGTGSTDLGDPYLSRFSDHYSNVSFHLVVRTHVFDKYFNGFNEIDKHNKILIYLINLVLGFLYALVLNKKLAYF